MNSKNHGGSPAERSFQTSVRQDASSLSARSRPIDPSRFGSDIASPHILVVDNEPRLTQVVEEILTEEGYRVCVANDARAALRLAEAHPPLLILSDIMMPGLDGLNLLAELRRRPSVSHVPVLFFTSCQDERLARQLGAWDVLRKPASRQRLLEKVFAGVAVGFMEANASKSRVRCD